MISLPTLDAITIPVSCPVSWDAMRGDHRTRFCDQCRQNVHDVSELTTDEALDLVGGGAEMPCLRLYRRADGRVMTADCMTRRERVWRWLDRRWALAASVFATIFLAGCGKPPCPTQGVPRPTQDGDNLREEAVDVIPPPRPVERR